MKPQRFYFVMVLAALACDDQLGPTNLQPGHLSFAPSFGRYAAPVVEIGSVDVRLVRAAERNTVLDTSVAWNSEADSLALSFDIMLQGSTETLDLMVTLRDDDGHEVYRNEGGVTSLTVTTAKTDDRPDVELEYVGPGKEAETVKILGSDFRVRVGTSIVLKAMARDAESSPVSDVPIGWFALDNLVDVDKRTGKVLAGNETGVARIEVRLATGDVDTALVTIVSNMPPSAVQILRPAEGARFTVGEPVTFEGSASDPEDGPLAGAALQWESDVDGLIGSGSALASAGLSVGLHTITLTATDSEGESISADRTITVGAMPSVEFGSATQNPREDAGAVAIVVSLSSASTQDVMVPFTVTGTATSPADYTILVSPLTIHAGQTSGVISVNLVSDQIFDPDETVIVSLGAPSNATLGPTDAHTITIADTVGPPTVEFTTSGQTQAESVGTITITVGLSSATSQTVSVPFSVSGTATDPADYTISASPLTIPAGQLSGDITINVVADHIFDPGETIVVALGAPTHAVLGTATTHKATISDGVAPTVDFTAAAQSENEDVGTMTITARLSRATATNVSVPFAVSGTASDPGDYTISVSPLTIPAGQLSRAITITVVDDQLSEGHETVIVAMQNPTNAQLGSLTTHTATIRDDDILSVEFAAASQNKLESAGTVTISVRLSNVATRPVSVPFTVGGTASNPGDYTISASPLTIPAGQLSRTISINLVSDLVSEGNETVAVTLQQPSNAVLGNRKVHTVTIVDDDSLSVEFTAASQSKSENIGTIALVARLSNVSTQAVNVPFTLSGTAANPADFTITRSPITIPAGQLNGAITITVANDQVTEPSETVIVTLQPPTNASLGARRIHTATIIDDDTLSVEFTTATQSRAENVGTMAVVARLSNVSTQTVRVPFAVGGSASNPTDFTISSSPLTIPAGQRTGTITITVVNDQAYEPDETVTLTLQKPPGVNLGPRKSHTATITNDDPPAVEFTTSFQSQPESTATMTIVARLSGMTSQTVTVPFAVSGTAASPVDYTISSSPLTIPAGQLNRAITINVVNDQAYEPDETVIVALGTPTNATLGSVKVHTATIRNDDQPPTPPRLLSMSATELVVNDSLCLQVQNPPGTSYLLAVDFTDVNGDVTAAGTYATVTSTFAGQTPNTRTDSTLTFPASGFAGTVILGTYCVRFGNTASIRYDVTLTDDGGQTSNQVSVVILKPPNSNSVSGVGSASARQRESG